MRGEFDAPRSGGSLRIERDAETSSGVPTDRGRGQTHLLGYVLLVGIVVVGSGAVLLFGGSGLEASESAVEIEHAERSLVEFTHATRTAAEAGGDRVPVTIEGLDRGTLETRADAGRLRIVREDGSGTEVLYDEPLGAVTYANGDTEIASQGGGVWRSDGDGTVAVSAPPLEYRDGSLWFPVVRVGETRTRGNAIDGVVNRTGPPTRVGRGDDGAESGDVRLEVESAYCEGWQREIESTFSGGVTERCSAGRTDRVRFELTDPPDIGGIDTAIAAHEVDIHRNAPPIEGDVDAASVDDDRVNGSVSGTDYDYPSVDSYVSDRVAACERTGFEESDDVLEGGRYCVETLEDGHTFDTSDGEIEVVVRDGIDVRGDDLRHVGENDLTLLVDGPVSVGGNAVVGNDSDPGRTQLLVSDDGNVTTARGTPTVAGLVYAPDSSVSLQGNPTVRGGIVAERVAVGNVRPGGVAYDERIDAAEVAVTGPRLRRLGVTAYEVSLEE
ncbi:hypothetical protein C488_07177 [Natrinema pellirubrum DSM 15624]|uniref:DUF7305 domain-containing protein n=1 Tax=Natrinema pellirubrum (strain DSM 15624 / CIP 106293 / JCM 10476 / NCIMB 786 / 157) TaxID=797303 RepID=L0JI52_NATP1|nr:hypothetical protein [Natrinema pellirubrum]AGB30523.1 hypothetical protein Natpe_0597 [Natrinema pellirubrum DSM 15624]ELY77292.1 hypothetical protein C488_07177 [Natrinema pellirubrum DSM 15624]